MLRKFLLGCGIASSALYVAADVLASLRYEGYRYADQMISELLANGAPTRPFMVATSILYNLLVAAFAVGVWMSAGGKRAARITAVLLLGFAAVSMAGGLVFQMDRREVLAAGEETARAGLHGPVTLVMSLFLLGAMGFGATLFGLRFRWYTYATILTLIVFGALTSLSIPRIAANEPTPWMGAIERVNIYATMLWVAVLALALWRVPGTSAPRQPGKPAAIAQEVPR
jgi:hypothetical protein